MPTAFSKLFAVGKCEKKSQNFFLANWKNPELILITMFSPTYVPNLETLLEKWVQECQKVRLIKWSIMCIFNEGTSMIETVRDLRTINVLAKFPNPWKIMDVRVLTVIFHVRSWKMRKKIAKIFLLALKWKNPELHIDYHVKPHLCIQIWWL